MSYRQSSKNQWGIEMDKRALEVYVKTFFTTLQIDEPELYNKTMRLFKAGKGDVVRDIMWEVVSKEVNKPC